MNANNSNQNVQAMAGTKSRNEAPAPLPAAAKVAGGLNILIFGAAAVTPLPVLVGAMTVEKTDAWIVVLLIASLLFSVAGALLGHGLLVRKQRAYALAVLHASYGRVAAVFLLFIWIGKTGPNYPVETGNVIVAGLLLLLFAFCWLQVRLLNREQVYQYFQSPLSDEQIPQHMPNADAPHE